MLRALSQKVRHSFLLTSIGRRYRNCFQDAAAQNLEAYPLARSRGGECIQQVVRSREPLPTRFQQQVSEQNAALLRWRVVRDRDDQQAAVAGELMRFGERS